jgi:hypothetical protein
VDLTTRSRDPAGPGTVVDIKTVLVPVSDLATAKAVYAALLQDR